MSFNYRQGGSWQSATLKRRENGAWATVGGGDGGGTPPDERFHTTDPGRGAGDGSSGADLIYDSSYSGDLQDALQSLSSGDRVWIDPSDGPYAEYVDISNGVASSITMDGYDPGTGDRAVLQTTGDSTPVFADTGREDIHDNPGSYYETSLAGSIDGNSGETVIDVADASAISAGVGDAIHITEESNPYGDDPSVAGSYTGEFRIVEDINTTNDTVTVNHEMLLPFPNNSTTGVGSVESYWTNKDIQWYGLDIEGSGMSSQNTTPFYVREVYEPWIENVRIHSADDNLLRITGSMRIRCADITVEDTSTSGSNYGVTIYDGSSYGYVTDITANNLSRYAVRFGANSRRPAVDHKIRDITATNLNTNQACKSHYGSFFLDWKRVEAGSNTSGFRCASRHWTLDGFTDYEDPDTGTGPPATICTRINDAVVIKNSPNYVDGWDAPLPKGREDTPFFRFAYNHDTKDEHAYSISFENITIEGVANRGIKSLGQFRPWDDSVGDSFIDDLSFHNIWYDGEWLTQSHVESWNNYDASRINNLSVTNDGGTPPGV